VETYIVLAKIVSTSSPSTTARDSSTRTAFDRGIWTSPALIGELPWSKAALLDALPANCARPCTRGFYVNTRDARSRAGYTISFARSERTDLTQVERAEENSTEVGNCTKRERRFWRRRRTPAPTFAL